MNSPTRRTSSPTVAVPVHVNDPAQALASLQGTTLSLPSSIRSRLTIPTSGADKWSIIGALSDGERGELIRTEKRLEIALTAAEPAEIKPYIVAMLMAFPAAGLTVQVAEMRVQMYQAALVGLPMWSIRQAVERFLRGEVQRDNHAFVPSPPEIAKEALALIRPYRVYRWEITKALQADVERSATDRERMQSRVSEILARFRPPAPVTGE